MCRLRNEQRSFWLDRIVGMEDAVLPIEFTSSPVFYFA
jgi:hypothetical protein